MNSGHLKIAGLSAAFSTLAFGALAQTPGDGYGHPHMWGGHGDWGGAGLLHGPLMVLVTIIILALVAVGVARLMGCGAHRCGHRRSGSNALAILEERFAKGEIDKAEFEERRNALKS